jgi:hypothetical protein
MEPAHAWLVVGEYVGTFRTECDGFYRQYQYPIFNGRSGKEYIV